MNIYAMHTLFRTLGQQQGLQQIRGILSESIDEFINEAILQTVRSSLLSNVKPQQDVRTPQYTKISSFNAYYTLFVTYSFNKNISYGTANDGTTFECTLPETPLAITNFAVIYKVSEHKFVKRDCRVIESERIHQTLNDNLNRASYDYPIISLVRGISDKKFVLSLFTGDSRLDVGGFDISYIKMPATVHFDESAWENDESGESVDCDLPEHLHRQIVETAVALWFQTLGLTSTQQERENNNKNQ